MSTDQHVDTVALHRRPWPRRSCPQRTRRSGCRPRR